MLSFIGASHDRRIEQKREQLADLGRRHHVRRLALFGSALRDDFDPQHSHLDFLVEFDPLPRAPAPLHTSLSVRLWNASSPAPLT